MQKYGSAASAAEAALAAEAAAPAAAGGASAAAKAAAISESAGPGAAAEAAAGGPGIIPRPGTAGPGRPGRCRPGRPGTAAHRTAGTPGGSGRPGPTAPENGIVHRAACHHRTAAVAVIAHAVQQGPDHKNPHDQQDHAGHADAGGGRGLLPVPVLSRLLVGAALAQGLGQDHVGLAEEIHRCLGIIPGVVGSVQGGFQLGLLGVGHLVG